MKEGWTYKKLGEVCDYHKEQGKYSGLPYIGMEHIESATGKLLGTIPSEEVLSTSFRFYKGEVLYGRLRPYLKKVYVAEFDGCCSTEIFPITSDCVDAGFIKYWLLTDKVTNMINATSAGCRMPRGNMNEVKKFDIGYPQDKQEQREIVAKLDTAFANIDALKANAEKQLTEARKLFHAELTECMRPKEGWEEKTLGDICKVINGRAYSKDEMLKQGKYRLLRVGNFFTNDSWYYSDLELEEDKYCDKGDLLYAWSASFGPRIWEGEKVIYHYHIWKMVCSSVIDKYFMFYWLDSDELKKQTMSNLHGATMAHITKGIIEAAHVSYPSIETQHQIVTRLDAFSAHVRQLEEVQRKTLAECDALKQAMLREVFE